MKYSKAPHMLLGSAALVLLGTLLLVSPIWISSWKPPLTIPKVTPIVPPTWANLPTRQPQATPSATLDPTLAPLQIMQQALIHKNFALAQAAWNEAHRLAPQNPQVLLARVRLALAQSNLESAEAYAWDALEADAQNAIPWAILGIILTQRGEAKAATQALVVAQALDPTLAPAIFIDRWRAAKKANDAGVMSTLAQTYTQSKSADPIAMYYRGTALIASGNSDLALDQLHSLLSHQPSAPAVLWYTLGQAYMHQHAYSETLTILNVVDSQLAQGDNSLSLDSDRIHYDLALMFAKTNISMNDPTHCAQAEPILRQLSLTNPELVPLIEQAIRCQTPTPTMTPWIPSQQITATPTPSQ